MGESAWFGGLYRDAGAISIPLAALDPAEVSLTYPDSVTSMGFLGDFGIEVNPREYHGQVYLLEDLPGLVQRFGIPTGERPTSYEGHQFDAAFEHYVEVQVWSDAVLNHYPQASGSSAKGSSR